MFGTQLLRSTSLQTLPTYPWFASGNQQVLCILYAEGRRRPSATHNRFKCTYYIKKRGHYTPSELFLYAFGENAHKLLQVSFLTACFIFLQKNMRF